MPKGVITNTKGRPGAKNKPETHLIKTYSQAWLIKLGQAGFDKWADSHKTEAIKIVAAFVPKEIAGPGGGKIEFDVSGVIKIVYGSK